MNFGPFVIGRVLHDKNIKWIKFAADKLKSI